MIPLYIWKWQMPLFFESSSAFPTVLPNADYSYYIMEPYNLTKMAPQFFVVS